MRNLKDIITERLVLSKNKSNQKTSFEELYIAVEKYQLEYSRRFKSIYLWPTTKTPKLLNFNYNAYLDSFYIRYKEDNMITVQFLGRNKRKTCIYIENDEELRQVFREKTITELYNYFTSFTE